MATGDIFNNTRKLQRRLKLIGLQMTADVDMSGLTSGVPSSFLLIYHYLFTMFSPQLAENIVNKGIDLLGRSDVKFLEGVYKVLRDMFDYKPPLTREQFFSSSFPEKKIIMCCEILDLVYSKSRTLRARPQKTKTSVNTKPPSRPTAKVGFKMMPTSSVLQRADSFPPAGPSQNKATKKKKKVTECVSTADQRRAEEQLNIQIPEKKECTCTWDAEETVKTRIKLAEKRLSIIEKKLDSQILFNRVQSQTEEVIIAVTAPSNDGVQGNGHDLSGMEQSGVPSPPNVHVNAAVTAPSNGVQGNGHDLSGMEQSGAMYSRARSRSPLSRSLSRSPGRNRDRERRRGSITVNTKRVYVCNVPYEMKWQDLKDLFRKGVGEVAFVDLLENADGKSKGAGIIEFKDKEGARRALEKMHRYKVKDRTLVVREEGVKERMQLQQQKMGGGGGGGGPMGMNMGSGYMGGGNMGGGMMGGGMMGNNYGISPQLMQQLGIDGPITNSVFVSNEGVKERMQLQQQKMGGGGGGGGPMGMNMGSGYMGGGNMGGGMMGGGMMGNNYGISPQLMQQLGIDGPITNSVFVSNEGVKERMQLQQQKMGGGGGGGGPMGMNMGSGYMGGGNMGGGMMGGGMIGNNYGISPQLMQQLGIDGPITNSVFVSNEGVKERMQLQQQKMGGGGGGGGPMGMNMGSGYMGGGNMGGGMMGGGMMGNNYGISPQLMQQLGIDGPITNSVFVSNEGVKERMQLQKQKMGGGGGGGGPMGMNMGSGYMGGGNMGGGMMGGGMMGNNYGISPQLMQQLGIDGPITNSVFVSNLEYNVTWKKLKDVFKLAGNVLHVEIKKNKEGKSKGIGVVEFEHPMEAVQAISILNNQELYGRLMRVKMDAGAPEARPAPINLTSYRTPMNS